VAWFGVGWFGVAWFGAAWFGVGSFGVAWFGAAWFGLAWVTFTVCPPDLAARSSGLAHLVAAPTSSPRWRGGPAHLARTIAS
jgi:hypothetical protein